MEEGYCDLPQIAIPMVGLVRPKLGLQEAAKVVCGAGRQIVIGDIHQWKKRCEVTQ